MQPGRWAKARFPIPGRARWTTPAASATIKRWTEATPFGGISRGTSLPVVAGKGICLARIIKWG